MKLIKLKTRQDSSDSYKTNFFNPNHISRVEINVSTERGAWAVICLTDLSEHEAPIDETIFCVEEASEAFGRMLEGRPAIPDKSNTLYVCENCFSNEASTDDPICDQCKARQDAQFKRLAGRQYK